MNSIGFLAVLDIISNQTEPDPSFSRISFLDKILEFLMTFDPRQIRYVGRHLLGLIDVVAAGKLFPVGSCLHLPRLLNTDIQS